MLQIYCHGHVVHSTSWLYHSVSTPTRFTQPCDITYTYHTGQGEALKPQPEQYYFYTKQID